MIEKFYTYCTTLKLDIANKKIQPYQIQYQYLAYIYNYQGCRKKKFPGGGGRAIERPRPRNSTNKPPSILTVVV